MNKYEGVELQVHHNNFSSGPALNSGSLPKTPLAAAAGEPSSSHSVRRLILTRAVL